MSSNESFKLRPPSLVGSRLKQFSLWTGGLFFATIFIIRLLSFINSDLENYYSSLPEPDPSTTLWERVADEPLVFILGAIVLIPLILTLIFYPIGLILSAINKAAFKSRLKKWLKQRYYLELDNKTIKQISRPFSKSTKGKNFVSQPLALHTPNGVKEFFVRKDDITQEWKLFNNSEEYLSQRQDTELTNELQNVISSLEAAGGLWTIVSPQNTLVAVNHENGTDYTAFFMAEYQAQRVNQQFNNPETRVKFFNIKELTDKVIPYIWWDVNGISINSDNSAFHINPRDLYQILISGYSTYKENLLNRMKTNEERHLDIPVGKVEQKKGYKAFLSLMVVSFIVAGCIAIIFNTLILLPWLGLIFLLNFGIASYLSKVKPKALPNPEENPDQRFLLQTWSQARYGLNLTTENIIPLLTFNDESPDEGNWVSRPSLIKHPFYKEPIPIIALHTGEEMILTIEGNEEVPLKEEVEIVIAENRFFNEIEHLNGFFILSDENGTYLKAPNDDNSVIPLVFSNYQKAEVFRQDFDLPEIVKPAFISIPQAIEKFLPDWTEHSRIGYNWEYMEKRTALNMSYFRNVALAIEEGNSNG